MIDELTITIIPVLLGDGIPLLGELVTEKQLKLTDVSSSSNGFVQIRYSII